MPRYSWKVEVYEDPSGYFEADSDECVEDFICAQVDDGIEKGYEEFYGIEMNYEMPEE